jgi:PAS domain S-box-containing protein
VSDLPNTSLRKSEGLYQHLFDSAPDVLLMIDKEGRIEVANSRCSEVLNTSPKDLHGTPVSDLLTSSSQSDFAILLTGMSQGTLMPEVEVLTHAPDGDPVPMMLDIR